MNRFAFPISLPILISFKQRLLFLIILLKNSTYYSRKGEELHSNYTYIRKKKKKLRDYFSLTYHTVGWHPNTTYFTLGVWLKSRITSIFWRWWIVFDPLPTFLCLAPQVLLWDGASLIRHSTIFLWRCVFHFWINIIVCLALWALTRVLIIWMGCIILDYLHFL